MEKFLQFLRDGLRLMLWSMLMFILLVLYISVKPGYKSLPLWLEVIVGPVLTSTAIVLAVTSFCWVFRLKLFSQDNPPNWYPTFERFFNFRNILNVLRGVGYIVLFLSINILICYVAGPVVIETGPEEMYFETNSDLN